MSFARDVWCNVFESRVLCKSQLRSKSASHERLSQLTTGIEGDECLRAEAAAVRNGRGGTRQCRHTRRLVAEVRVSVWLVAASFTGNALKSRQLVIRLRLAWPAAVRGWRIDALPLYLSFAKQAQGVCQKVATSMGRGVAEFASAV